MAYPTVAAPYGLRPVKLLSGVPYVGTTRQYSIASGYATDIFYGDAVKLVTGGTVERDTFDAAMTPIGVFLGCSYTDPSTGQTTFNQYYPASTAADDIMAYVASDPFLVMQMQSDEALTQDDLGKNVAVVQTAGSTAIGTSKNAIDGSTANTTNTLPLKIIDFVEGPDSAIGDAKTDAATKS